MNHSGHVGFKLTGTNDVDHCDPIKKSQLPKIPAISSNRMATWNCNQYHHMTSAAMAKSVVQDYGMGDAPELRGGNWGKPEKRVTSNRRSHLAGKWRLKHFCHFFHSLARVLTLVLTTTITIIPPHYPHYPLLSPSVVYNPSTWVICELWNTTGGQGHPLSPRSQLLGLVNSFHWLYEVVACAWNFYIAFFLEFGHSNN